MCDKNTLISDIYELKELKKSLEEVVSNIKSSIASIDSKIESKEALLIEVMRQLGLEKDSEVENLVAAIFKKENIGYRNDAEVLSYLKSINRADLIKVKTTESLDKVAIKKAIKADSVLADQLADMTTKTITEYVIVTTADNYTKMLEHIDEGSNK